MTNNENEIIKQALFTLAGKCDFAQKLDGVGFNAFDTQFGHSLADQASVGMLTDGQYASALKMLRKYRKQLADAGIELPSEEAQEAAVEKVEQVKKEAPAFKVEGNEIRIYFYGRPSPDNHMKIKAISKRKWAPELSDKPWVVPASCVNEVIAAWSDKVTDEIIELASKPVVKETKEKASIKKNNGTVEVKFPYSPDTLAKFKNVISERRAVRKNEKFSHWEVPTRLLPELVALFPDAKLDAKTQAMLDNMAQLTAKSRSASSDFIVENLGGTLYPFQSACVEFMELSNGRAVIADDMGLGKTIEVLAYLQLHKELRPAILVVPASVKINWLREALKWLTTNEKIETLTGRKPYKTSGSILIINWDILTYWADTLIELKPAIIIGDEAHYAKNSKSKRSKAMKKLTKAVNKIFLLTGTPITNRPIEYFPLLNMVAPEAWPNFFRYAMQYCNAYQNNWGWDFSGASNLQELHEKIKPYVIRRTKGEVLEELPPKRRNTVVVEFDEKLRAEYEGYIKEAAIAAGQTQAEQLVFIEKAKQVTIRAKMKASLDWLKDMSENEKLIVFCTHNWTVDKLMEAFGDQAVKITGSVTLPARQDAVDKFQDNEDIRIMVANIKAGGVGITLTASSNVIFLEYAWTPGDQIQAEDRAHRIGQENLVTVWNLVAENTIDEYIVQLLDEKRQIIETVQDGKVGEMPFSIQGELLKELANSLKEK